MVQASYSQKLCEKIDQWYVRMCIVCSLNIHLKTGQVTNTSMQMQWSHKEPPKWFTIWLVRCLLHER